MLIKLGKVLINLDNVTSIQPLSNGKDALIKTTRSLETHTVPIIELNKVLSENNLPMLTDAMEWPELPDSPEEWGLNPGSPTE